MNLYPDIIHEGDLSPDAVGSEIDEACKEIHEACKGFGTDDERLMKALATKNAAERYKISIKYKEVYGKELKDVLHREVGGDLGTALQFLSVPLDVAECDMIKRACKGMGTNELVLYPIVLGRSNAEMEMLKKAYYEKYTADLGRTLDGELAGDFEKIIFTCLQASEKAFDPDFHNEEKVEEDVKALYEAGQGKTGTDEKVMFKILCSSPPEHLKKVNLAYAEKYGYTLSKAFEKELVGKVEEAVLFELGMKTKPYETVAGLIKKACAGFGSNELLLTCCLIRYQSLMKEVDMAHVELYGKRVSDRVKDETGGKYESLLLTVIETGLSD